MGYLDKATKLIDSAAEALSPEWGAKRLHARTMLGAWNDSGYVTPGSPKKSMKGITATSNSPDYDTLTKIDGSRALSRDLSMNSPVAISALRRAYSNIVGPGLQMQSNVDRDYLGLESEEAEKWEADREREFDLWANNYSADYHGVHQFSDLQIQIIFNTMLDGDVFFMLPWRKSTESPYECSVKIIPADLVRNPTQIKNDSRDRPLDIRGGVERDRSGKVVAYHVAKGFRDDMGVLSDQEDTVRIPVFGSSGQRQIWHYMPAERAGCRRGMPVFAPVLDVLKQITRLSEAELMHALVSSFFTAFVKDLSGLGSMLQQGFTPPESVTGGGGYGPDAAPEDKTAGDEFDLEMGHGNVVYLDKDTEVQLADPKKIDGSFEKFFESLAMQACAAASIPVEQVLMKFNTSYTAAKAASNEAWKTFWMKRVKLTREFCDVVGQEVLKEGILKERIVAAGYFDDLANVRAWSKAKWIGPSQGQLNPLDEAKASVIKVNNKLSTHSEEYTADKGGRWDEAMEQLAREKNKMEDLGIEDDPSETEILAGDGQENETQDTNTGQDE